MSLTKSYLGVSEFIGRNMGVSEVIGRTIELRQNWSEDELQRVFRSAYTQIFGREGLNISESFASAEALLRNGSINVRQFVQMLAKSESYKERFFYCNSQVRFIELNYQHLLGRAIYDQTEVAYHVDMYASQGYDAEIDSYLYSLEYDNAFGSATVPYYRGFQSINGMKQVGFNRLFQLYRGNGSSDNAQGGGKSSRLRSSVAMNLSNMIIPPGLFLRSLESLAFGHIASSPVRGDKRVYLVESVKGGLGTKVSVRRSRAVSTVPFDQLSAKYQEIHKSGGKIVSVKPV
jgi:phycoerythrocyanin-associated rod linker protein